MKCLSIQQPYVELIANGIKTIECRSWQTSYRGDILICSAKKPFFENYLIGHAICIVTIIDITKMQYMHYKDACINKLFPYAWKLINPRKIKPFLVRGQQGIFELPTNLKDAVILL